MPTVARNHQRNRSHSGTRWLAHRASSARAWSGCCGTAGDARAGGGADRAVPPAAPPGLSRAPRIQDLARELAARLGLARTPRVWWIEAPLTPMLWAVGCRARLIIPTELWKSLNDGQRSLLLVHELAHLQRGDHLLRLFELAVTALYWWLPVVWWARYALRDAEEQCCDAWVVWAFPKEARTYAETLLETVDFLNPSRATEPLLASGFGKVHHLRRRLTMIMLGTTPRHLGWGSALGALPSRRCSCR